MIISPKKIHNSNLFFWGGREPQKNATSNHLSSWLVNLPPPNVPPPQKKGFHKALLRETNVRGVRCGGRLTSHNLSFTFQIGNCINILVGSQMMLPRVFLLRPKLSSTIYSLAENGPWCPRKIPRFHQQLITLSLVFSSYDRVPIRIEGKTTAQHRLWTGGQEHERFCRLEPK